jgi:methyltransferase (TIGR00027 family)
MTDAALLSKTPALSGVATTAFLVAACRAEEAAQPHPLYRDEVVSVFLDDATRQALADVAAPSPAAKKGIRLRTRYLDDALDREISLGCRQVLILGAGLDTRAVRKRAHGVAYFEIDEPALLDFKRERLRQHGIDPGATYVGVDYVRGDWLGALQAHGFDCERSTHVIWEGNTMYLALLDLTSVLWRLRHRIVRTTVSFDYFSQAVVDKTTGDDTLTALAERFERLGAPWVTGIADVGTLAWRMGCAVLNDTSVAELHRRHWPGQAPGTTLFEHYGVCTLASQRERRAG